VKATATDFVDSNVVAILKDGVSKVILTGVGPGPQSIDKHLIDETGELVKN